MRPAEKARADWRALVDELEPLSKPVGSTETKPLYSMAISLKRIADRLDGAGSGDGLHGLHSFVLDLAYQARTNFERGKRRA